MDASKRPSEGKRPSDGRFLNEEKGMRPKWDGRMPFVRAVPCAPLMTAQSAALTLPFSRSSIRAPAVGRRGTQTARRHV